MLNDPEVAERLAALPEPQGKARPNLSEFDQTQALLSDILDRLGEVIAAVIVTSGGKAPKIQPAPRPTTGVARFRERAAIQRHDALVAEVKAAQERWKQNREGG